MDGPHMAEHYAYGLDTLTRVVRDVSDVVREQHEGHQHPEGYGDQEYFQGERLLCTTYAPSNMRGPHMRKTKTSPQARYLYLTGPAV